MRTATEADVDAAMRSLIRMREKNPGKQMQYTDVDTARDYITNQMHNRRAVVVDDYFILFDIGSPWYSNESFLIEELVIRTGTGRSPPSVAVAALDELREMYGCKAVIAGDTQIGAMVPHYKAAGYVELGVQLMKE